MHELMEEGVYKGLYLAGNSIMLVVPKGDILALAFVKPHFRKPEYRIVRHVVHPNLATWYFVFVAKIVNQSL